MVAESARYARMSSSKLTVTQRAKLALGGMLILLHLQASISETCAAESLFIQRPTYVLNTKLGIVPLLKACSQIGSEFSNGSTSGHCSKWACESLPDTCDADADCTVMAQAAILKSIPYCI
jgi:hypothetical protein